MILRILAFILSTAVILQGAGFLPSLPQPIYYGIVFVCFISSFGKVYKLNSLFICFVLVAVFSLILNDVPAFFKSEQRLIAFFIVAGTAGPFFLTYKAQLFKNIVFLYLNKILIILSSLSFLTYIFGVSFAGSGTGVNSGFFNHSLMLGPFAAISIILLLYALHTKNTTKINRIFIWLVICLCFFSLLISSSRSSIISLVISLLFYVYKLKQHKVGRIFKTFFSLMIVGALLYPIWFPFTEGVFKKNKDLVGSEIFNSREAHWLSRVKEFSSSPIIGVGFASAYIKSQKNASILGVDKKTGIIESGSSWLSLLSMTGLVGFSLIFILFFKPILFFFKDKSNYSKSGVLGALLVFFVLHMNAEGYILAAGSLLCFYVWLLLGIVYVNENNTKVEII